MSAEEIAAKLKGVHVLFEQRRYVLTGGYDEPIVPRKKPRTLFEIMPVAMWEASQNKDSKLKPNNGYNKWVTLNQLSLIKEIKPVESEQPVENKNE